VLNLGFNKKNAVERPEFERHYTGNWVWRAVAALIDEEGEYPPSFFSEKLNAPIHEIHLALEGLEKLGIIRHTPSGYKKILKYIYYTDQNLDPKKLLSDHVLISTQILGRLTQTDQKSFYRTSFIGTTEKRFIEFCLKIETTIKDFLIESTQTKAEKVYAMSLSCVDLTRIENKNDLTAGDDNRRKT
jgi:hypothetical protein